MTRFSVSLDKAAGRTGRGVAIAVVDSGIHASHPHVGGISGEAAFDDEGRMAGDVADRLGHGTAVAAAIREKAPEATLLSVKVFHDRLATTGRALVEAIDWAIAQPVSLVNLSLGTTNAKHADAFAAVIARAAKCGVVLIAAAPDADNAWLPGGLAGVVSVEVDWSCPRDRCHVSVDAEGRVRLAASGWPRPIPGIEPERNFRGPSFAVANATGLLALAIEGCAVRTLQDVVAHLATLRDPAGLKPGGYD
jgi:subtilisin family serine protease